MKKHALMAVVVTLTASAVSYTQTVASKEEPSRQERPADASTPSQDRSEDKQSLSESLEKAKKGIGDTLEKTGEAVREKLGMTKQGCLKRGDEADPYLLEESESAEAVTVVGSADLANHINHTVRLHGREEAEGRVFHATTVEQIAASCDPLPDKPESQTKPPGNLTAGDQGTSAADRKLTQAIRQAVVRDETLSMHGHNIKIISQNGFVTLKGLVRSEDEKRNIEAKAVAAAGIGKVSNELTVQAGNANPNGGVSDRKN